VSGKAPPGTESPISRAEKSRDLSQVRYSNLGLPTTFLSRSAPSLRRLRAVAPNCLSHLLSSTTNLVELTLTLDRRGSLPEASLISNLRRMSCLRRLELKWSYLERYWGTPQAHPSPPDSARDIVPLPKLTDLSLMVMAGSWRCS
jgi:hypothetical protein